MQSPVVQAEFDAITRDGLEIVVTVAMGDLHDIKPLPPESDSTDVGFFIEVEPLMKRTRQGGTDSLMAMCFSIELVRKALTVFVSHGGSLFMRGSRYPIDLQSSWFDARGGIIRPEYLQSNPTSPEAGGKLSPPPAASTDDGDDAADVVPADSQAQELRRPVNRRHAHRAVCSSRGVSWPRIKRSAPTTGIHEAASQAILFCGWWRS